MLISIHVLLLADVYYIFLISREKELSYNPNPGPVIAGKVFSSGVCQYGICSKILYTKMSDKMAYGNSADPDQTAPVCHSTKYFKKKLH